MTKESMGAADALGGGQDGGAGGSGEGGQQEGQEQQSAAGTFFIPKDVAGGKEYKPGETITLEVVGTDEDGDLEVKMAGEGEGGEGAGDWRDELRTEMAGKEGGAP